MVEVGHFCQYDDIVKATMSGISCISTHIFVNINCIIKHEASKFL